MTAVTNTHELAVQYGEVVAMQHHKHGYQPNTDDTHKPNSWNVGMTTRKIVDSWPVSHGT